MVSRREQNRFYHGAGRRLCLVSDGCGWHKPKDSDRGVLDGRMQLVFHPAWSPDGRTIAYRFGQGLDRGIHLITADGEYLKRLGDVHKE